MIWNHRYFHVCDVMGRIILYCRHILTMPPDALVKGSFPSVASTILWFSFCFLFIAIMMYVTAACRGWSFLFVCCIINHCCLIIVVSPTVSIYPLQGLYMVKIVVRELFFPKIVKNFQRPDETFTMVNIALPPGLQSEFMWCLIQRYKN